MNCKTLCEIKFKRIKLNNYFTVTTLLNFIIKNYMQLNIYNSEKFNRNKFRYVAFSTIIVSIFVLSILHDNIVGAILLFFVLGGYFYYSVRNNQTTKASITKQGLIIGTATYPRNELSGYVLEVDTKQQKIKNIVFITQRTHTIHTINDEKENIKNFIVILDEHLPMLGEYNQSFLEKLTRKFQL